MMNFVWHTIEWKLTGLWELFKNNSVLVMFIIAMAAIGFFVPFLRRLAWGLAAVGAIVLCAYNLGDYNGFHRSEDKHVVLERQLSADLDDARQKALTTVSARPAPGSPPAKRSWLRRKAGVDQYDRAQKRVQAVAPANLR